MSPVRFSITIMFLATVSASDFLSTDAIGLIKKFDGFIFQSVARSYAMPQFKNPHSAFPACDGLRLH